MQPTYFLSYLISFIIFKSINCYERKFIHDLPHMLTQNLNITTFEGETVKLPCQLANLGNYHVNWLKVKDQVPLALTVGYQQFSRNMRYRVARVHDEANRVESWNFEIRRAQLEDSGFYECYVKLNQRHKIKANVFLDVKRRQEATTIPRSERLSSSNKVERIQMYPNTWIKLRCNATNSLFQSPSDSSYSNSESELQWFKDGEVIQQDSRRLKKWVASYDNSNYMELDLYAVDPNDSGNYQCKRDLTILKNVILSVNTAASLQNINKLTLYMVGTVFAIIIHI